MYRLYELNFIHNYLIMERLLAILTILTKMPEQDLTPILGLFESVEVPAKKLLLAPDTICPAVWVVGSGSIRAYYTLVERKRSKKKDETISREVTNWIIPTGGVYTDMLSFSQRLPSSYYIETLEASQLFTLSHQNYKTLLSTCHEVGWKVFEHVSIMAEQRVMMSNLRYPEDRLNMMETMFPGLMSFLPVHIQASYISMGANALSKLRNRIR